MKKSITSTSQAYSSFAASLMLSLFLYMFFCPIYYVEATIYLDESSFQKDVTLKKQNSPYYVSSDVSIPKSVVVKVDPGVSLVFDSGTISVYGSMYFNGTETLPVYIKQQSEARGFTVVGGILQGSYMEAQGGSRFLDAYSSSTVTFSNIKLSNITSVTGTPIAIWRDSILSFKDSSLSNIQSSQGINVFLGGSLILDSVEFNKVGSQRTISVFNNLIQGSKKLRSTIEVLNTTFNGLDSVEVAVEVFNDAFLHLENSSMKNFKDSAVLAHSNAEMQISQGKFLNNKKGIESYNSNIVANDSEFEGNTQYAVIHGGGSFEGKNNWWGSSTGPYSLDKNPKGTGDSFYGLGNISPWLTEKKKGSCCSNVLFIPGLQGSRMYKKNLFNKEKQLWEPGSNTDVSKLFLDAKGESVDKSLYVKDIIGNTNIGFGRFDIEVYEGFIRAMNKLEANFSIRDWSFFPYDWRSSPNTVAVSGAKIAPIVSTGVNANTQDPQFKTMESEIIRLSASSKTKKVSIISHSYGGLITKRFLAYLASRGRVGLIDKVIFVGVPEYGSPSALFALLHGDNQEIGNGYILNKNTARSLAQNMPSTYALLPSENTKIIRGIHATSTDISTSNFSIPDITNITDMYNFILGEIKRPFTSDKGETFVPIIGNFYLVNKIKSEKSLYKEEDDPSYKDISFYNILGLGINTLSSVTYLKNRCVPPLYIHPTLVSPYCGLDHIPNYSKLGDGTVLLGNLEKRWGDKYLFDIGSYNSENGKNYSHANSISSEPSISAIMQVLLGNIGHYQLPKYISHYGGSRQGSLNFSNSTDFVNQSVSKPTYVLSASENLALSTKDSMGNISGADLRYIEQNKNKNIDFLPIQNTSQNSSYAEMGNSSYILIDSIPKEISVTPLSNFGTGSSGGVSLENDILRNIDISLKKVEPESIGPISSNTVLDGTSNTERGESIVFEFKDIPVTEYSDIKIHVDVASTVPAVLNITEHIDGVYDEVKTYTPKGFESNPSVVSGIVSTGVFGQSGTSVSQGGFVDIAYIIAGIRESLTKSSLRTNFKNRYLLKLKTIETYNKSTNEKTRSIARKVSKDVSTSLVAIIKDLSRYRAFYYKGGMQRGEAIFLYSQFVKLSRAYGDV